MSHVLEIVRGKTFRTPIRWEDSEWVYVPITAITNTAPVQITAPGHGCPEQWRGGVVSVKGMREINARSSPPDNDELNPVTVLDADTVEINLVNAADYHAYHSGGYLVFRKPIPLAGTIARMAFKTHIGGEELLRLESVDGGIEIDVTNYILIPVIADDVTAAIPWDTAVCDMELVDTGGEVVEVISKQVVVRGEVTT